MAVKNRFMGSSLEVSDVAARSVISLRRARKTAARVFKDFPRADSKSLSLSVSAQVTVPGFVRVRLPLSKEEFRYNRVKMLIHNVIWGKLWIEV